MKRCLDEGLLQAYMDGELSPEEAGEAAAHIAACPACAESLAEAENENAFFATAFGPDESLSVPSEILRSRINAAVARLESTPEANNGRTRGWGFGGFLASLSGIFTFTPQGAVAFASLLALVAVAAIYFAVHKQPNKPSPSNQGEIAKSVTPTPLPTQETVEEPGKAENINGGNQPKVGGATPAGFKRPGARHLNRQESPAPQPKAPELLPGEKEYQTAIASLEKTIKLGGDVTLKPSTRVEYERNLALLDSAISQTRSVATKNPKDRDAVGFLMSAYQSKVELLTQVAEQAQVAALGR